MKPNVNIGIVGTGMIARVITDAIASTTTARLVGVSSRDQGQAEAFAKRCEQDVDAFGSWQEMVDSNKIDAVYIGTPTSVKEEIAVAALKAGKHALVDKPFASLASAQRMIEAAKESGAVLMDATQFVHHPRTASIKAEIEKIGPVTGIRSAFYFPFSDRNNIRFNPRNEPTGALGDLAWYNMRAAVEFFGSNLRVKKVSAILFRDSDTGSVIRGAGLIAFADDKTSTWDIGYTAGTVAMDLDIIGTSGIISLDDFVLDWNNSFAFQNEDLNASYQLRHGTTPRPLIEKVDIPRAAMAHVLMIDDFAATIRLGVGSNQRLEKIEKLEQTQALLDVLWQEAQSNL